MKKGIILISVVMASLTMTAQQLRVNQVDDFTGSTKKYTKFYNLAKTNVGYIKVSVMRVDDYIAIEVYSTSDLGCAGASGNYIMFLYEDGTSVKLDVDHRKINCKDNAPSLYLIKDLNTNGIAKIRLRQSEYYTDGVAYGSYSLSKLVNAVQ